MTQQSVAIITGAGRGIGRATAIELARVGYHVALLARTQSDLNETAKLSGADRCTILPTDVSNPSLIETAVAKTVERFGRLDAVVNCAGLAPMLSVEKTTNEIWRDVLETNLSSAFYLCRSAWPIFSRQKSGVAVLVSSEAARDPFPGFCAYAAAKAGLNSLGLSLAREGAERGIRTHVIAPGATETQMLRDLFCLEQFSPEQAMAPEDVAHVIVGCVRGELKDTSGEVIYLHR